MATITSIEFQKKNKDRVNIYVDGEYLFSVYAEMVYKYNLEKGKDVDKDYLVSVVKEDDFEKAKNKALNSISRVEKSEKKIREKLVEDFDEDTIERVIEFLKKHSFVDDKRFANRIIENDQKFKKIGKRKIKQNLYLKGIEGNDIEKALSNLDEETEKENAIYLANKRLTKIKDTDKNKIRQKLYQHLSYKGFSYDIISHAINIVMKNDDEIYI